MNEEELSAAVTELQATNKSLQSQHTEILKTSQLIRLQMEEMTLALRSLAQQMGATTSVLDGLAGESALRNSDLVLSGRRSDGSERASSDPSVQTQPTIRLVPLKRLEDEDEVAGVEDEDDDVEGDGDIVELAVVKPETTSKRSDLSQIGGEQATGSFMALNENERRTNVAVMASFQPIAKLEVFEKPPPWPPPSTAILKLEMGDKVARRGKELNGGVELGGDGSSVSSSPNHRTTAEMELCNLRFAQKQEAKSVAINGIWGFFLGDADYSKLGFEELKVLIGPGEPIWSKEFSWEIYWRNLLT